MCCLLAKRIEDEKEFLHIKQFKEAMPIDRIPGRMYPRYEAQAIFEAGKESVGGGVCTGEKGV